MIVVSLICVMVMILNCYAASAVRKRFHSGKKLQDSNQRRAAGYIRKIRAMLVAGVTNETCSELKIPTARQNDGSIIFAGSDAWSHAKEWNEWAGSILQQMIHHQSFWVRNNWKTG